METARCDLRVRLLDGPPRLRALASSRLEALGVAVQDHDDPAPEVLALVDPCVVLDVSALRAAAAKLAASGRAVAYPAREVDGSVRDGALTLIPRGATAAAAISLEPLGTWLPSTDPCRLPGASPAAAIYGIFREPTGYANLGRNLVTGLAARGITVATRTAWWAEHGDAGLPPRENALLDAAAALPADAALPSLLLRPAGDASGTPSFSEFAATRLTGPVCAVTMFECDDVPARWVRSLRGCDQVWVPSRFNLETFAQAGVDPERLRLVPIGIDAPAFAPDGPRLELPNRRRTAFLAVFDWNERKGPDVLLRAWARAFGPDDDVVLYLRTGASTVGAHGGPDQLIRGLGLDPGAMAPIEILSTPLPLDAYAALFRSVDAFVLTSRGEAFCIPLLEAMASGVPAIGTGYGGSADFLDETTGFPIPSRLVAVGRELAGRIPFYAGQRWADPSIDATVAALRRIVDDPRETACRAAHAFARAHIDFDRRATAAAAASALAGARAHRTVRTAGRAVLTAPLLAATASGRAARAVFDALEVTGATPRLEPVGPRDADLDPVQARRLRTAARLVREPGEAALAVDLVRPDTRAVLLTAAPPDVSPLMHVAQIWATTPAVAAELIAGGVPPTRVTNLDLPLDVTLWTPDARGPALAQRTVFVAAQAGRVEALAAFIRVAAGDSDTTLVLAPGDEAITGERIVAELNDAWAVTGLPRRELPILALPAPVWSREAIRALATMSIALAADPSAPQHEYARACGVPVLGVHELDRARTFLADVAARDAEGIRVRRAAVARARAAAACVRTAYDGVAALAPLERRLRLLRIVAVLAPTVAEPERVFAELRASARHELVGVDSDLGSVDYVVRVERAVEAAPGWDELLINALEARDVAVAESFDWDLVAPNFPEYTFEDMQCNAVPARNCEAGASAPQASGALRLTRATDATAIGPAWRCAACIVRPLVIPVTV